MQQNTKNDVDRRRAEIYKKNGVLKEAENEGFQRFLLSKQQESTGASLVAVENDDSDSENSCIDVEKILTATAASQKVAVRPRAKSIDSRSSAKTRKRIPASFGAV